MNKSYEVELRGCTPDPLMAYLKALGIFRLVSEQKDSSARAWWQGDTFFLHSALDREGLADFFLNEYRPTPIASPWNNRYKTGVMKGDKAGPGCHSGQPRQAFFRLRLHNSPDQTDHRKRGRKRTHPEAMSYAFLG